MPAYGSYDCGVYKRLMRSMSSSLVSNNSNTQINNFDDCNLNDSLNKSLNENNTNVQLGCKKCVRIFFYCSLIPPIFIYLLIFSCGITVNIKLELLFYFLHRLITIQ
jgi:hypothetical protein